MQQGLLSKGRPVTLSRVPGQSAPEAASGWPLIRHQCPREPRKARGCCSKASPRNPEETQRKKRKCFPPTMMKRTHSANTGEIIIMTIMMGGGGLLVPTDLYHWFSQTASNIHLLVNWYDRAKAESKPNQHCEVVKEMLLLVETCTADSGWEADSHPPHRPRMCCPPDQLWLLLQRKEENMQQLKHRHQTTACQFSSSWWDVSLMG